MVSTAFEGRNQYGTVYQTSKKESRCTSLIAYDLDALTADCYDGTACLINKFDIHDNAKLAGIESAITFTKTAELDHSPIEGSFDFEHYKSVHRYLFEDIYDWAGTIRTVDVSKKGTVFVLAKDIEKIANTGFIRLKAEHFFKNYTFNAFCDAIVDFYCVTNMPHPFREGNGRTQRVFISQLIRYAGYDIDFSGIDSDELMIATIQVANGVRDNLLNLFRQNLSE